GSEESNNYVDSDNVSDDYEFLDPCIDLEECNVSFLHKIFIDNDEIKQKELTACVVIDFFDGKFQRCGNKEGNIRQLRNLIGTWQVDRDVIREVDGNLQKLG
ncbi:6587_t:CDS:2, partial [Rhizophagus irregularis]